MDIPGQDSPDTTPPPSGALIRALAAHPAMMADLVVRLNIPVPDADALLELMGRASREAVRILVDVDWAGVTAEFDGRGPFTAAHTDQRVLVVDECQYEVHDGPCLQAMRTNRRIHMTLDQVRGAWPQLATGAAAQGVNSFLAIPLHAPADVSIGSLNLYSSHVNALGSPDEDLITVLTEYMDLGLSRFRSIRPAAGMAALRAALARHALVEQAVGVLMVVHRLDQERARDLLHGEASSAQVSVGDHARNVVDLQVPPGIPA